RPRRRLCLRQLPVVGLRRRGGRVLHRRAGVLSPVRGVRGDDRRGHRHLPHRPRGAALVRGRPRPGARRSGDRAAERGGRGARRRAPRRHLLRALVLAQPERVRRDALPARRVSAAHRVDAGRDAHGVSHRHHRVHPAHGICGRLSRSPLGRRRRRRRRAGQRRQPRRPRLGHPMNLLTPSRRLASWIDRRRRAILIASAVTFVVGAALASRLPVRGDFANLLPPDAQSVQDLKALEGRARAFGMVTVVIEADDPALRARAADVMKRKLQALPAGLVAQVTWDDADARRFAWQNRFLYASIDDLVDARDALREHIRAAKLKGNPLYVDLEDEPDRDPAPDERTRRLRDKIADAERAKDAPSALVSKDGRVQLVLVRTPFAAAEVSQGSALVAELDAAATEARRVAPGAAVGLTGDVITTMHEHRSILEGMVLATVLTVVVVGAGLLLYYRTAI